MLNLSTVRLGLALTGVACLALSACQPGPRRAADRAPAGGAAAVPASAPGAPGQLLHGADDKAWLTAAGDMGDSGYCSARLKLPMAADPAWTVSYTSAEISPIPAREMVHYNGLIVCSAGTAVVFGINATTGQLAFKTDQYLHTDEPVRHERFHMLQFSPSGELFGLDNHGHYYSWAAGLDGLQRSLVSGEVNRDEAGFVVNGDQLVGGGNGLLAAFPTATLATPVWSSQLIHVVSGVVATNGGTIVAWTREGGVQCCAADGTPLWQSNEAQPVAGIALSLDGKVAYIVTYMGELRCRDLATGKLQWSYDWSEETPRAVRLKLQAQLPQDRFARVVLAPQGGDVFRLQIHDLYATPDGPLLAFENGGVLALDRAGHVRWRAATGPLLDGGLALSNALLVHVVWRPITFSDLPQWPWLLQMPDWPEIQPRAELAKLNQPPDDKTLPQFAPGPALTVIFGRLIALDMQTGQLLETLPEAQPSTGALLPAQGKVVMPLENRTHNKATGSPQPCKIVAYNWLEQGS